MQLVLAFVFASLPLIVFIGHGSAQVLSDRSVNLSTSIPNAVSAHTFNFTVQTPSTVGSIVFNYCANSPIIIEPCSPVGGLDVRNAIISSQLGNSGFVVDTIDTTAQKLVISRPPSAIATVPSSFTFNNITNPTLNDYTTYVRISTYSSTQGGGSYIDYGAVAFSTTEPFTVNAYVPPYINFCVGVTVALNCSSGTGFGLDLGNLTSTKTNIVTSQISGSSNDNTGYATYIMGQTMTSGNNIISPNSIVQPSLTGVSQFGINLRANSSPASGADSFGGGTSSPTPSYGTPNQFTFVSGDLIANSPISTTYNRLTVTYLVNIDSNQAAGVYSTTITYLASADF
jgi:hypothetical protein